MDLDKFINENLDEILENPENFIGTEPKVKADPNNKKNKKVAWKEEIEIYSKITDNQNEDETTNEELQSELFEQYYNKKMQRRQEKMELGIDGSDSDSDSDLEETGDFKESMSEHKLNLLNLFLRHYNEKYEKCENYFHDIKNIETDTSSSMEMFFEALVEFKKIKQTLNLNDEECMDYYFEDSDNINIKTMFDKFPDVPIYCLNYANKYLVTPSILICLNYLVNNKKDLFGEKDWNIFNLRDN